uniref:Uncharacterized protein n=1 Tax=Ralstonia solanacearum TaxID=305 RepID=A0A0S4V158_RALSL|nr:protein of unknown function [Ralstonia solanacearum]
MCALSANFGARMKRVQFDRYGSADAMRVGKYEVR